LTFVGLQYPPLCLPSRLAAGGGAVGWLSQQPRRPWRRTRRGNRKCCPLHLPLS